MRAFNTWAYKREQPSDVVALERVVNAAIRANRPVDFVLYWGKGPRSRVAKPDLACLDYLGSMATRIEPVHAPGARITLVETDTHARLNGHSEEAIEAYYGGVSIAAKERGFCCVRLSKLTQEWISSGASADFGQPDADVLDRLHACAARWYRGDGSVSEGAARYYEMNMIEKRAVERAFPTAVFVTFNGSEYRGMFPDSLPIFFMYSVKRGTAVKPWFMEEDASSSRSAIAEPVAATA
ncbi:MAG: hypothetical protein F9K44_01660 [Hyphomicrobiaceae bacterium]|nr:MAG: hypothetical protein F9K44_01660 [Hyphomicrobiaceae bacterium]